MQNELNELNEYRPAFEKVCPVIDELNDELESKFDMPPCMIVLEYYGYNGYAVKLMDWVLYFTESESRDHDEETDTYESLDLYLRRVINERCAELGKVKL